MSEKAETQFQPPKSPPPHDGETRPLPDGWIKQFDTNSSAWFYVDTTAAPPRSIWVHPFDDPMFLEKHPEYKDYDHEHDDHYDDAPPEYMRRPPSAPPVPSSSRPSINDKGKMPEKRSFFGKLKDKAIGTKEEREAARVEAKRIREAERKQRLEYQRAMAAQYGAPPQVYTTYQQPGYGPGPSYGNQTRYVYTQQPPVRRQGGFGGGGFGGGGAALPLLGGLAGGFLLGDLIGGDGFGGGDFGGDGFF